MSQTTQQQYPQSKAVQPARDFYDVVAEEFRREWDDLMPLANRDPTWSERFAQFCEMVYGIAYGEALPGFFEGLEAEQTEIEENREVVDAHREDDLEQEEMEARLREEAEAKEREETEARRMCCGRVDDFGDTLSLVGRRT